MFPDDDCPDLSTHVTNLTGVALGETGLAFYRRVYTLIRNPLYTGSNRRANVSFPHRLN